MISTSGHLISKFPEVRFHRTRISNFRKIANFGSLPKIKKSKIECLFSTWKNANTHFSCLSKKQYADFTTFISSVNPHIGSKTYFHFDKRYYIFQIFFACVKSQSARFSISLSSQIFF